MRQICATQSCAKALRCRDTHKRARSKICVPFWAAWSCLLLLFLTFFLFSLLLSYNSTDFSQYISARIKFRVPILVAQKRFKNGQT